MSDSAGESDRRSREDLDIALEFVSELLGREANRVERAKTEAFLNRLTRRASEGLADDSRALRAQSQQTLRHMRQGGRPWSLEQPTSETNVEFVGRLLAAAAAGDLDLISDLVPEDVDWRPVGPPGSNATRGATLREFWDGSELGGSVPLMFHGRDEQIVAQVQVRRGGGTEQLWLVFCFDGTTLVSASAHAEESAVEHALRRARLRAKGRRPPRRERSALP